MLSANKVEDYIRDNTNCDTFCDAVHKRHSDQAKVCRDGLRKIAEFNLNDCGYHKESYED